LAFPSTQKEIAPITTVIGRASIFFATVACPLRVSPVAQVGQVNAVNAVYIGSPKYICCGDAMQADMTTLEIDDALVDTLETMVRWGQFEGITQLIEKLASDWTEQSLGKV
jgi:hypothetical protein